MIPTPSPCPAAPRSIRQRAHWVRRAARRLLRDIWWAVSRDDRGDYLARATDLCDLERRMRALDHPERGAWR